MRTRVKSKYSTDRATHRKAGEIPGICDLQDGLAFPF